VTVTGPGVLDVTLWQQKNSITVHLVNLTNPMMMKGPIRELIPVGPQEVRVRLPAGTKARSVRLLAADKTAKVDRSGQQLTLTVPSILDHEVVAIDLKAHELMPMKTKTSMTRRDFVKTSAAAPPQLCLNRCHCPPQKPALRGRRLASRWARFLRG
jgi:hypothetical protein